MKLLIWLFILPGICFAENLSDTLGIKLDNDWSTLKTTKVVGSPLTTIHHKKNKELTGIYKSLFKPVKDAKLGDSCPKGKTQKENLCIFEQKVKDRLMLFIVYNEKFNKAVLRQRILSFEIKTDKHKHLVTDLASNIERQL